MSQRRAELCMLSDAKAIRDVRDPRSRDTEVADSYGAGYRTAAEVGVLIEHFPPWVLAQRRLRPGVVERQALLLKIARNQHVQLLLTDQSSLLALSSLGSAKME